MDVALVTAIGSFSADIVIKSLHAQGFRVIGCDIYPAEWVVDSANVDVFYRAPLASSVEAYEGFINDVCLGEHVKWVLPLTDVEVDFFTAHRGVCPANGATACISPLDTIAVCRNKAKMAVFLGTSSSGIKGIPTRGLASLDGKYPGHPVVVKPLDGRSSSGLHRIHSAEDWGASVPAISDQERYIVQPLVEGSVVTVDVVRSSDGSRTIAVPREELLRTLNGAGTSVRVFHDTGLSESCAKLADELGIIGCVNFEFIKDEQGEYHFLECNPRFSGGVEFTSIAAYDCVANHMRAFAGKNIEPLLGYEDQFIARKYEEYVMKVGA